MEKVEKKGKMPISKTEKIVRTLLWGGMELFTLVTLIYYLFNFEIGHVLTSLGTMGLLLVPFLFCKIFRLEVNNILFCYSLFYAIGPLLGSVYNMYYLTTWWDDLLHASAGVIFAILGVYLADVFNHKGETGLLMKLLFALFFSIAIAALWEFVEYGVDQLFDADMQKDRVIDKINSFLIGGKIDEMGVLENITEVTVNGQPLGIGGYLDIGLHDTMSDMMIESFGALVVVILYALDRERHPLIYKPFNEEVSLSQETIE